METTVSTPATEATTTSQSAVELEGKEPTNPVEKQNEPVPRKFKAKVNGKEVEVDEATLLRDWQKSQSADERFRKASEIEKRYSKYEDLEKALQNKDLSVLSKYVDKDTIKEFSEKQLLEWLEYQGLSDEQKEHLETKKKLGEYESEKEQARKEQEEQAKLQISQQAIKLIDDEIANTFKELGRKPTPAEIMRMAMHMDAALVNKQFISGKEAYRRASKDLTADLSGYLETLDEKDLPSVLPKKVIDAIRRQSIEATQAPFARSKTQESTTENRSSGKIRATTDDYFKTLDQKYQRR